MKHLLVVDNNPLVLDFMKELLGAEGYEVSISDNGLDALHRLQKEIPDVIFIDLVMPQIDGSQLTNLLRADPRLNETYIVIISGVAAECKQKNVTSKADAYIAKSPFKKMGSHILQLLSDLEKGKGEAYREKVLGCENLYQREITNELLYSKHHLEILLSQIDDGFVEMTMDGEIIFVNPAACSLAGKDETELITSYFPDIFSPRDKKRIEEVFSSIGNEPIILGEDDPFILYDRRLLLRFLPITYEGYNSISTILQDITERKKAEKLIRESLERKETLLKEVHHRVKNNLSVIASLLNLQSSHVADEEVRKHLIDSRNRVESMALVHERLYTSEDFSGINLQSYIEGIIQQLLEAYSIADTPIQHSVRLPSINVTMELAVPIGLIINEVISNSLEHGFGDVEDYENARIDVRFSEKNGNFILAIEDNGKGFPEGFDPDTEESETLGLLLSHTLAEQIHGRFGIQGGKNGVTATVYIPIDHWKDKIAYDQES